MARIVLAILGIFWILFGLFGLLAPATTVGAIGIDLSSSDALADARAVYGGSQIGIGLFFLYCSRAEERLRTGLIGLALIAGGLALARSFGMVADGARSGVTLFALATEIVALALALIALLRRQGAGAPAHV